MIYEMNFAFVKHCFPEEEFPEKKKSTFRSNPLPSNKICTYRLNLVLCVKVKIILTKQQRI